ncbi:MAG: DUF2807 domain-containing protein [Alphaproteobacteria bacterium]|nr:DUF2807 domain-containing protein [Alphaproteobacteria bacterium]
MTMKIVMCSLMLSTAAPGFAEAATQQYSVTNFDTVRMQAPFHVTIVTGQGNSARGEGERDALDRVSLSVSGGVLTIRASRSRVGQENGNPGKVSLIITTATVRRVLMGGNGVLSINGMKGTRGDINMAGNGDLEINGVALDQLVINSAGSGRIRLSGSAGDARVQVIGAGNVEAPQLVAKTLTIDSQGPGSIVLTATGTADVIVKGSGDVTVRGRPACKTSQAGSGQLICGSE